ncbi:MAG: ABC transporter permease [Deltaproteobacteria bacterium]|nr:ABC transporter permease [Deltaproteobacteria bacterium]
MRRPAPRLSRRFVRVWQRDLTVYRKIWKISLLPPLLEPLLYLAAFGVGLSGLVGAMPYRGTTVPYLQFIAPGLLAINIMQNAFFENTYGSFVRMVYQKTFSAILSTPLSAEDVIAGEIAWGATKSVIATAIMMAVILPFGFVSYPEGLLILPLALLGGLAFGAVAMTFTATIPSIDVFNLPTFLFVTPMFFFSGTFFSTERLPHWAQLVALALPLTHVAEAARALALGRLEGRVLWNVAYLVAFVGIFFPLSLRLMRRRLIE